ncbi:hypothetical protein CHS0354_027333 [Potamilus streckersoni]|uniref:Uncharacterized protein n=1 Tax=Potamilus streckersoni TaxID=2493646 RepID=A0AAE0SBQ1_9BIVA|nr:hypothetical protein CHS0354_027333 [Potamilus streckersoni]
MTNLDAIHEKNLREIREKNEKNLREIRAKNEKNLEEIREKNTYHINLYDDDGCHEDYFYESPSTENVNIFTDDYFEKLSKQIRSTLECARSELNDNMKELRDDEDDFEELNKQIEFTLEYAERELNDHMKRLREIDLMMI